MIGTHTFAFTLAVMLQLGFEMCFGFLDFAHLWSSEIVPHVVFLLCSWQQQEVKKKLLKEKNATLLIYLKHENVKKHQPGCVRGFQTKIQI